MTTHTTLRIALAQTDMAEADVPTNLCKMEQWAAQASGKADLLVFPEMATTGFQMREEIFHDLSHGPEKNVFEQFQEMAERYKIALAGSVAVKEKGLCYNRAFLIAPNQIPQFQDKRHLFRPAREHVTMQVSRKYVVWSFMGWRIRPIICYDLRFPVWCRNHEADAYDLLLVVANWPKPRRDVWITLLKARAIENQCYVVGVNRVGTDMGGLQYVGDSMLIDARGIVQNQAEENRETIVETTANYTVLHDFRAKFPVLPDADDYQMNL